MEKKKKKTLNYSLPRKSEPIHHFHFRKRLHEKFEPYPHPHKFKFYFDKAIYLIGLFGPLMTTPQIYKIWVYENASGISLISWGSYIINSLIWITYGILHKEYPIILVYSSWMTVQFLVLIGAVLYG